ncbi:MAG: DNA helicase RecQ [Sphingobacteriales bacterium]|nr:MAG: DNA helicase RecQ [Sphingobacteriales bacterium]
MPDDQLSNVLQHRFGFSQFRFHQEAIIRSVLAGSDVMAIMPTGGGKSICYQLPALMLDGITIVISPLIALMKDQVDGLKANGIAAAFLNSSQSAREQEQIREQLKKGAIRLLYIAPERLFGGDQGFFSVLKSLPVALFAIDEAHCISQWGHDFRPEYLRLAAFKEHFPQVPVIALTASADKITQQDILEKLRLRSPRVFVSSFNRPNIHYFIQPKKQAMQQIADYLHTHADSSGIIYALSRAGTEDIAHALRSMGFIAAHYHAGLSNEEKNRVQESFKKDDLKIIVATIAFGMGIDKPNVRFVMHYDVPKNMEGYYQETGRAGRDGLKSDAILYYSAGDIMKLQNFISIEGNPEQTAVLSRKLFKMKDFAETQSCRRQFIMDYFGEEFPPICGSCDFCLSHVDQENVTIPAQKFLSAIYRTGERFGSDYIIDFLRGSSNSKIQEHHKSLKTYGIGKDLRKEVQSMLCGVGSPIVHISASLGRPFLIRSTPFMMPSRRSLMGFSSFSATSLTFGMSFAT